MALEIIKTSFRAMRTTLPAALREAAGEHIQGPNRRFEKGAMGVDTPLHPSSHINVYSGPTAAKRGSLCSIMTGRSTSERDSCAEQPMASEHHA